MFDYIYSRADGGFVVWDMQVLWRGGGRGGGGRTPYVKAMPLWIEFFTFSFYFFIISCALLAAVDLGAPL